MRRAPGQRPPASPTRRGAREARGSRPTAAPASIGQSNGSAHARPPHPSVGPQSNSRSRSIPARRCRPQRRRVGPMHPRQGGEFVRRLAGAACCNDCKLWRSGGWLSSFRRPSTPLAGALPRPGGAPAGLRAAARMLLSVLFVAVSLRTSIFPAPVRFAGTRRAGAPCPSVSPASSTTRPLRLSAALFSSSERIWSAAHQDRCEGGGQVHHSGIGRGRVRSALPGRSCGMSPSAECALLTRTLARPLLRVPECAEALESPRCRWHPMARVPPASPQESSKGGPRRSNQRQS
jgi:hypothetical protein